MAGEVADTFEHIAQNRAASDDQRNLVIVEDTGSFLAVSDVRLLRPLAKRWRAGRRRGRWAFVVPDKSKQSMAQMIVRLLRLRASDFECFSSEATARDWLLRPGN